MDVLDNPKKRMIECLKKNLGNISNACEQVGIVRQTHYNWMENDETYRNEFLNIKEAAIDFVESKLFQSIQNGSDTAMIFFLKTQAKKRGYIEKTEIQHEGGGVNIQINWPDGD
jgi:hypothetical protein